MPNEMQTRREFLKTTTAATLGSLGLGATSRRKPNLLFLWTDQQRPWTMAAYGNERIHTPNLNMFSKGCFVFERTYVTQPVCTPSRSSVLTGLWPHTSGLTNNNIPLPEEIPCLPELLRDPDYRTAYMGKWHLGDEIFAQHGFQEWKSSEEYQKYFRPHRPKDRKSDYWSFLKNLGYEPDETNGYFSRSFASKLPIEHCKPKFLEISACDFLRRHQKDPFILHVNFLEPHTPYNGPLNEEHPEADIQLPSNYKNVPGETDPLRYRIIANQIREKGYSENDLKTEEGWRRIIRNYWGLVSQVDRSVGAILNTLEELGLAEDTIVVFTSDHGDMMGAHGLYAKTVMYEESTRVPLLMRIPWLGKTQQRISQPVSHIDLVPTLLGLLGKDPQQFNLSGKSWVPMLEGGPPRDEPVFIEWNPSQDRSETTATMEGFSQEQVAAAMSAAIRTIVTPDGWKLCLSDQDKNQLFNLKTDPGETSNVYSSPGSKEIIARLEKQIREWQETVKDTCKVS
jgi:arylsulfatase A-like enzyme